MIMLDPSLAFATDAEPRAWRAVHPSEIELLLDVVELVLFGELDSIVLMPLPAAMAALYVDVTLPPDWDVSSSDVIVQSFVTAKTSFEGLLKVFW